MFIHRNTGRRAAAVSLGMLTVAAIAQVAYARNARPIRAGAHGNRAGGPSLTRGNYGNAAQTRRSPGKGALAEPQALDTHRCAAHSMAQQFLQRWAAFGTRNMTATRARQNVNSQTTATATLAGAHE